MPELDFGGTGQIFDLIPVKGIALHMLCPINT